ncbi:hypothetical protein C7M84_021069 [Penaeus vannamei]|uniref:Uncharacterized protein n=1 Tax=Penaeus vannamei TaxID=6689 RepID=A0A3R7P4R0_PENVA|nr:hypothetical protein C7M84_021069 [Penaeus vannamei]
MAFGGGPEWKEWIPLTPLLDQLPQQFQRGLATSDLQLTCLASLPQHLVLGTNVGLVYLAHLPSLNLMRLKCENPLSPISSVSGVSTVDDMIAAGALDGTITIFQLPRVANVQGIHPPNAGVLGSRGISTVQPTVKRFTVGSIHSSRVTSLTWSRNGMRLFSGDTHGVVSNLLGIKSKIMTQGSGFLDHIARMSSSVAAKVQEHATPTIVTGQNGKWPASQTYDSSQLDPVQHRPTSLKAQQNNLSSSSLNIGPSRQELGHQRSSSSGMIQEPQQRPYSPSLIPPRMVQSVSSFFPALISSQSLVKTFGKTPPLTDVPVPGEREVIGDLEEIVTSSQIVAQEGADAEPLVMRDKSKKKNKRRYDATPSPDTMSINSYRSTQSDVSDATSSELPSSPSMALSHSSVSPSHRATPQDLSTTLTECSNLQAMEDNGEERVEVDGGSRVCGDALEVVSPAKMSLAARNVKQMSLDDELAWYIREEGQAHTVEK